MGSCGCADSFAEFAVVGAKGTDASIQEITIFTVNACSGSALATALSAQLVEISVKHHSDSSHHALA